VAKRSEHKATRGGHKRAWRTYKPTGTAIEEVIATPAADFDGGSGGRPLQQPLLRGGEPVADPGDLRAARDRLRAALVTLPWDGLKLSRGEPAIPTVVLPRE
jgi:nicotinate phosphoribosyltransferase